MNSYGFAKAYKDGWNAAAAGILPHKNPFPNVNPINAFPENGILPVWAAAGAYSDTIPGQTNYNLWLSGYSDYVRSPFNCEAEQRYTLYKVEGIEFFLQVDAMRTEGNRHFYSDGSSVELTPTKVTVFGRDGAPFIQLEFQPSVNTVAAPVEA